MANSMNQKGFLLLQLIITTLLLGMFSFQAEAATPSPVRIGIGAVNIGGNDNVFYQGFDGNVWENYWTGSSWTSLNLGTPPGGVSIVRSIGANVNGGSPFGYSEVFVVGSDGNLWDSNRSGSSWTWLNLSRPSGVNINSSLGVSVYGNSTEVFVMGSDGNIWEDTWNGSTWVWRNLGTPNSTVGITAALGTAVVSGAYTQVYVKGTDGNVWEDTWNGSTWVWYNLGKPSSTIGIANAAGTFVIGNSTDVFVIGTDGNIWETYYDGSSWGWHKVGAPTTVGIAYALGSVLAYGNSQEVFVLGTDGNVWEAYYNGSTWVWTNPGNPGSASIVGYVGMTVPSSSANNPQVYVIGSDSSLWQLGWNGSGYSWNNQTTSGVTPGEADVKYQIMGVDYAPPGVSSTVSYGSSSLLGTSTSNTSSFKVDVSETVSFSFSFFAAGTAGASASYSQQTTSTSSIDISTNTSKSVIVAGPASSGVGVDHDYDVIWIWLNPQVQMTPTGPTSVRWGGYNVNPQDPAGEMDVVPLYVYQLKNPSTIPAQTAALLARSWDTTGLGGLTTADYATILAADPLAASASFNPTTDTSGRFDLQAGYTFSYAPAPSGGQPITQTYSVQSSQTTKVGQGATYSYQVGLSYGVSGNFYSFMNANLKTSETYTLTDGWNSSTSNGYTSTAALSITGPASTDGYTGPTEFQVWRDNVYGTYMFYPVQ